MFAARAGVIFKADFFDAVFSLKDVSLDDKKTGSMNLEIQAAKAKGTWSSEQQEALKTKRKSFNNPIAKGQWHDLLVHVAGDKITAVVDGREVGSFQSEGFAHPTKNMNLKYYDKNKAKALTAEDKAFLATTKKQFPVTRKSVSVTPARRR